MAVKWKSLGGIISEIDAISASICSAIGSNGAIYKCDNGSWDYVAQPNVIYLSACPNDNTKFFAIGGDGAGYNWDTTWNNIGGSLQYSICSYSSSKSYSIGSDYNIWKYYGSWDMLISGPFSKICLACDDKSIMYGVTSIGIFKTTDEWSNYTFLTPTIPKEICGSSTHLLWIDQNDHLVLLDLALGTEVVIDSTTTISKVSMWHNPFTIFATIAGGLYSGVLVPIGGIGSGIFRGIGR
jgi:hypothetical protein